MNMKKLPLHLQIIIALILGALVGILFSVNPKQLIVFSIENGKQEKVTLEDWSKIYFVSNKDTLNTFQSDEQISIIKFYEKNRKIKDLELHAILKDQLIIQGQILDIEKPKTIATRIKPIGTLFIRLLSFLAIPLVISSLIVGAASLGDVRKLGRIGLRTFAIYITTTAIAITIGLGIANIIEPGKKVDEESKNRLLGSFEQESAEKAVNTLDIDVVDFFVNIVPKNPLGSIANGEMLQIVFFSVMFGITLTFVQKKYYDSIVTVMDAVSQVMIKMVDIIMKLAPYGVFALIAATIADFGFGILYTLIWYSIAVIIGLLLQTTVVYGAIVYMFGKIGLVRFFAGLKNAQAIAFSTSSSAATLPITFQCVENNLDVKKEISGFVLPLGATINMDGTALYQGVAAVFIAQVYGMDLGLTEQLTIVLTAVLASIGTAPVPGVGLIMLVLILDAIHVPKEGIALILGVDRILDMLRTVTNVTGDSAVAVAVNGLENK